MADSSKQGSRFSAGTKFGSYSITRCIGEGGMGVVYEGMHQALSKRVAIKTLNALGAQSPELVARFVREAKAAAKISHPNVVDVVDVSVQDGIPYLVMEYLEGEDLGARMEHHSPMGPGPIADLMIPVISALCAAHEAGIVHRDLKPDNIFLSRSKSGAFEPKLVDFGISKLQDGESLHLTGTGAILGTPYYMSPEQAGSSKLVDHRSDIFSLGVILYQCATHELPFKGDSLYKLLGEILHSQPPSVRSIAHDVTPAFEAVIVRAMQKDPAARFQSAAELGAALLPFASPRVRLSYEHEFGAGRVAISAAPEVPRARNRALLLAILVLGLGAAIAGGFALRGKDKSDTDAHLVAPQVTQPAAATSAEAKPKPETLTSANAAQAVAVPTAVPDAGTNAALKPASAEPAKQEHAAAETTNLAKTHERGGTASSRRKGNHPAGSDSTAAPAASTATQPEHAAPSSAANKDEDLFRDRK